MGDGKMWNVKEKISLYEREETFFKHIGPLPNKHGQLRLLCKRRPGIDTIDKQRLKMWHGVVNFTMNNAVILATII